MSRIKIGGSPLSWMNADLPELNSGVSFSECLAQMALIGFEGWEYEGPFAVLGEQLPLLCKRYKLPVVGGWHSTFVLEGDLKGEIERLKEHVGVLKRLGGTQVNLCEGSGQIQGKPIGLSGRPRLEVDEWKALCEGLDELAAWLLDQGMKPVYHHHMGTVVQTGEDIDRLMGGTKSLELLFDSGHLAYAGDDPLAVLERHIDRVGHVHAKNVRQEQMERHVREDLTFFSAIREGVFTVPGCAEGALDFEVIVDKLWKSGYEGWIIMEAEQDPAKADPWNYALRGYETLRECLSVRR